MSDARFTATTTPRAFGEIIFDVYFDVVTDPYAISLIESAKVEGVHNAVSAWATALRGALGANRQAILAARSAAQKIEVNQDWQITDADWYVDLWDAADKMAARGVAAGQSAQVKSAVEAAVLRKAYRPPNWRYPNWDYSNTHGLSIFWPAGPIGDYASYVGNSIFYSTRDGTWDEFLKELIAGRDRAGLPVQRGPVERLSASTVVLIPLVTR